jgi:hypothetical protein
MSIIFKSLKDFREFFKESRTTLSSVKRKSTFSITHDMLNASNY